MGRRAADGNFGASTEKVFLDLTRANDYDLTGSGAATGIQIDKDAGDIAAVVTLDAANSNNVSGLGGGSNYGNLVLQSTVQSSAGFDADITISNGSWSSASDVITITGGANYNWGNGTISVKGLTSLSRSGTVSSATSSAATLTFD